MASRGKPDPAFSSALFAQVLDSDALAGITPERRAFLADSILPVLFEALPELLQAVDRNTYERSGDLPTTKYGGSEAVEPIDPIRWLGEYLFRHNPRYDSAGATDDHRLRVALRAFAMERAAASKEEKK
jgi:hypothetical protein